MKSSSGKINQKSILNAMKSFLQKPIQNEKADEHSRKMTVQFAPQLETVVPIEKVGNEKRSRSNWNTNEVEENSSRKAIEV